MDNLGMDFFCSADMIERIKNNQLVILHKIYKMTCNLAENNEKMPKRSDINLIDFIALFISPIMRRIENFMMNDG